MPTAIKSELTNYKQQRVYSHFITLMFNSAQLNKTKAKMKPTFKDDIHNMPTALSRAVGWLVSKKPC